MTSEYQEWLSNLKVGDKVVIEGRNSLEIAEITKITKTGQMQICGRHYKFKNGIEMISGYHHDRIEPVTDAIIKRIEKKQLLRNIDDYDLRTLSIKQLREIKKIIWPEEK